jgi:hypothetical protein
LRRWGVRLLRIAALVYLGLCLALYLFQNWIIFPGAYIHREKPAMVLPAPGREVLALRTAEGKPFAAIFGTALDTNGLPGPDAATCPTILYFYGNGDCVETSLDVFQRFRQLGANVLIPEFVGYPMSGGKPSEANLYATADAAYAYLLTRPDINPKHIVLVGRSLGAAAAIDLASRKPVAGLACFSAFTSMDVMAGKVVPMFPTALFLSSKFNNLGKIAGVKCPIYLAHGTADDFVPYAMMAQLAGAARVPITTFPIVGADHNSIYYLGGQKFFDSFQAFVDSLYRYPSDFHDNKYRSFRAP